MCSGEATSNIYCKAIYHVQILFILQQKIMIHEIENTYSKMVLGIHFFSSRMKYLTDRIYTPGKQINSFAVDFTIS